MLNVFDSHVHTDNSPDGFHSITHLCEMAVAAGVMGVAITDHYECNRAAAGNYDVRLRQSLFETTKARVPFGGCLHIARGIELGQGHLAPEQAERVLSGNRFDVVLGALHTDRNGIPFCDMDFNDPDLVITQVLENYFPSTLEMVRWGRFDVLAHLGQPEQYIWGQYRIPVNLEPHMDTVEEILKALISEGIALEVNTSGLRHPSGFTFPREHIVRLYRQLGGELITIGSNAHHADSVGMGFDTAMQMLRSLGFEYFAFYSGHKPIMLKLI